MGTKPQPPAQMLCVDCNNWFFESFTYFERPSDAIRCETCRSECKKHSWVNKDQGAQCWKCKKWRPDWVISVHPEQEKHNEPQKD